MRRIDEWMPLFISRYLADTVHLNNAMSGSYLHALMYEWVNGPLPNDMEVCARIMKMEGLGSPDLARALLKRFFMQDSNACWIQKRLERVRADLIQKATKYSERAHLANTIRWQGHVARRPTRIAKESHAVLQALPQALLGALPQAMLGAIPVVQVLEVQDQHVDKLRLSPEGQPQAAGLRSGVQKHIENGSRPNGQIKGEPAWLKTAQDASQPAQTAGRSTRGEKVAVRGQSARKTALENGAETAQKTKRPPDARFVPFRREVLVYWKHQNPGGLRYGWTLEDGRALNNLLRKYKTLELDGFKKLLRNRAQSEAINPAADPASWIARLGMYASGPLDRFGKPQ